MDKSNCSYIMLKLLQVVHFELHSIFGGAVGHPLQHHLICLQPVANAVLYHWEINKQRNIAPFEKWEPI